MHPTWARTLPIVALLVLPALPRTAGAAVALPTNFVNEEIVGGLDQPTSFAILPDWRVLVTEQRTGKVRLVVQNHIAATDPVLVVPSLNAVGNERGLQSIAVDPDWPSRPYVYLCYTRTGNFERIVRYTASGNLNDPVGEGLALGGPLLLLDNIPDVASNHNAGCLRFGPDGYLFASLGDDDDRCKAADSTSLKGALLRLDVSRLPAGPGGPMPYALLIPPSYPLATSDSTARLVWAYGLRNPWRFHVDPSMGAIYVADVGEDTQEELDEVLPGDYLGWPYREGTVVRTGLPCSEPGGAGANAYKGPILAVPDGTGSTAISSGGMYRPVPGAQYNWPSDYAGFYGDVFYGDYYAGYLRRLKKQGGVWGRAPTAPGQPNANDWATGLGTQVDFQVGPDGSLWWLAQFDATFGANTGKLQRIKYLGSVISVAPPAATASEMTLRVDRAPFGDRVGLTFELPAPGPVELAVMDLAGRRVRSLLMGSLPAGSNRIFWDGRDDAGKGVGSGVYFAWLKSAGQRVSARIVRVR